MLTSLLEDLGNYPNQINSREAKVWVPRTHQAFECQVGEDPEGTGKSLATASWKVVLVCLKKDTPFLVEQVFVKRPRFNAAFCPLLFLEIFKLANTYS